MSKSNYTVLTQNRFAELLTDEESDSGSRAAKTAPSSTKTTAETEGRPRQQRSERKENRLVPRRTRVPVNGETAAPAPITMRAEDPEPVPAPHRTRRPGTIGTRGGRGEQAVRGGHRPFDRHSGTGRGKEMKKSGAGGHNWGNDTADFGGVAENIAPAADSPIAEEEVTDESGGETTAQSGEAAAASAAAPAEKPQEKVMDYAEYQRTQRLKRQNLLQEDRTTDAAPARCVDATELEKAGFQKYEREETPEEKAARELMQRGPRDEDSEEETSHRQRTYNLSEFTGRLSRPGNRGRGRGGRSDYRTEETHQSRRIDPVTLDLTDVAAFPSLA